MAMVTRTMVIIVMEAIKDMSDQQIRFSNLVALFLSEVIRSRRTTVMRAAEISRRVVDRLQNLTTEEQALKLVTDLEREFEEVSSLKMALHFNYQASDVKVYEKEIKEFAAQFFALDMAFSVSFLNDASEAKSVQELCLRYPNFCSFLLSDPQKAALVNASMA
jgi:hypothetical protein